MEECDLSLGAEQLFSFDEKMAFEEKIKLIAQLKQDALKSGDTSRFIFFSMLSGKIFFEKADYLRASEDLTCALTRSEQTQDLDATWPLFIDLISCYQKIGDIENTYQTVKKFLMFLLRRKQCTRALSFINQFERVMALDLDLLVLKIKFLILQNQTELLEKELSKIVFDLNSLEKRWGKEIWRCWEDIFEFIAVNYSDFSLSLVIRFFCLRVYWSRLSKQSDVIQKETLAKIINFSLECLFINPYFAPTYLFLLQLYSGHNLIAPCQFIIRHIEKERKNRNFLMMNFIKREYEQEKKLIENKIAAQGSSVERWNLVVEEKEAQLNTSILNEIDLGRDIFDQGTILKKENSINSVSFIQKEEKSLSIEKEDNETLGHMGIINKQIEYLLQENQRPVTYDLILMMMDLKMDRQAYDRLMTWMNEKQYYQNNEINEDRISEIFKTEVTDSEELANFLRLVYLKLELQTRLKNYGEGLNEVQWILAKVPLPLIEKKAFLTWEQKFYQAMNDDENAKRVLNNIKLIEFAADQFGKRNLEVEES